MDNVSYELTYEALMNQQWKYKHIVGFGVGIYVGEGVEAKYIAKGNTQEVSLETMMQVYETICRQHNAQLSKKKYKRRRTLRGFIARIKQRFEPKFVYPDMPHEEEEKKK